jgi:hypothetical protein
MFDTLLARGEHLAEVEAQRALLRFLNGVDWLIRDPSHIVGRTPYEVVFARDKLEVRRYHPADRTIQPRHAVPVLCIPPLMVKPFIFDLMPGRSLVRFLLDRGFDVFLVDFGEPDGADALVTLDDYVLDWIPTALAQVRAAAACRDVSLARLLHGRPLRADVPRRDARSRRAQSRHHRRAARHQQDGTLRLGGENGRRPGRVPRAPHRQRARRPVERRLSPADAGEERHALRRSLHEHVGP